MIILLWIVNYNNYNIRSNNGIFILVINIYISNFIYFKRFVY